MFAVLGAPAAPGEGVVCTDDTTLPYSVRTGARVPLRLRRPPFPRAPHIRVCTLCSIIRLKRSRQHDGRPATAGAIDAGLNCVPLACTEGVDAEWADSDCCAVPANAGCAPGYAASVPVVMVSLADGGALLAALAVGKAPVAEFRGTL